MTRIDNCNIGKVCESDINFPSDYSRFNFLGCERNFAFHTQYMGKSHVVARLHLSHKLAPPYTAYFTSSFCNTPPQYCTCIKLQVQYLNPVSSRRKSS